MKGKIEVTIESDNDDDYSDPPSPPPLPADFSAKKSASKRKRVVEEEQDNDWQEIPLPPPPKKTKKKLEDDSEPEERIDKQINQIVRSHLFDLFNSRTSRNGKWITVEGQDEKVLQLDEREHHRMRVMVCQQKFNRLKFRRILNQDWLMTMLYGCFVDKGRVPGSMTKLQHRQLIWRYNQLITIYELVKKEVSAKKWDNGILKKGKSVEPIVSINPLEGSLQPGEIAMLYFMMYPGNWISSPFQKWSDYLKLLEAEQKEREDLGHKSSSCCWPFPVSGNIEESGDELCECQGWVPEVPVSSKKTTEDSLVLYCISSQPVVIDWFGKEYPKEQSSLNSSSVYYCRNPLNFDNNLTQQYLLRDCHIIRSTCQRLLGVSVYDCVYSLFHNCCLGKFAELGFFSPVQIIYSTYFSYLDMWGRSGVSSLSSSPLQRLSNE